MNPAPVRAPAVFSWRSVVTRPSIVGAAVMLGIVVRAVHDKIADPDLWWHLKTGQLIVATHALPSVDAFSFTSAGRPWVVQEWGSEVVLHGIVRAGGFAGLIVWRAVMLVLIYAVVARLVLRATGNTIAGWAIVGLGVFAGATSWTERPNLFSFLFFVITLALCRVRDRRAWWFVPLAAVWANMHGMVLLGLGLVALIAITEWMKLAVRWEGADRAHAARLALVTVASILATMVNPYGPGALTHGFHLINSVSSVVTEWASPDFHSAGALVFLILLVVAVAALALSPVRADPTDVALVLAFVVLGLFAVRNLPVSGIVLAVVTAPYATGALDSLRARRPSAAREEPALNAILLATIIAVFGFLIVSAWPRNGLVSDELPVAAIRKLPAGARLLTPDSWAGLAIYERWPDVHVAFDTRVDFYTLALAYRHNRTLSALGDWNRTLDDWCVTHVLVPTDRPLATVLAGRAPWSLAFSEPLAGGRRALLYSRAEPACTIPGQ